MCWIVAWMAGAAATYLLIPRISAPDELMPD
jgi:hypothetical protein